MTHEYNHQMPDTVADDTVYARIYQPIWILI
jgi:hypothetical protein